MVGEFSVVAAISRFGSRRPRFRLRSRVWVEACYEVACCVKRGDEDEGWSGRGDELEC